MFCSTRQCWSRDCRLKIRQHMQERLLNCLLKPDQISPEPSWFRFFFSIHFTKKESRNLHDSLTADSSFCFSGNCERMIAPKIKAHPTSSLRLNTWWSSRNPKMAENTDSSERIKEATDGSAPFWPIIWSVYPAPLESTPAYRIGPAAETMAEKDGV